MSTTPDLPQQLIEDLISSQEKPRGSRGAAGRAVHLENALHEAPKYVPGHAIDKIRYSHDAIIDAIIESPEVSQDKLSAIFGYTPGWVSQIMSSDAFKARLEQRKDELVDPRLRMTLNEKFNALVNRSLDIIQDKMASQNCDPEIAFRAMELGAKALGLGGNRAPINIIPQPNRLDMLAQRLTGLLSNQQNTNGVYDVQATRISEGS